MNAIDLPAAPPVLAPTMFPAGFQWGAATSAAQIEGAWDADGRGPSIWDRFCREPGRIKDRSNIDTACDHYHRWAEDVELMQWLGLGAYRFSIAWPRVQAQGQGAWNEAGFGFYDRLIDGLLEAGIRPHATLYHWDLPAALHDRFGGWLSRDVVPRFADYAAEVARRFGDRLHAIATLNEPWCVATLGYETAQFAPGLKSRRAAAQVSHHLMLAHGHAIQAMRAETQAPLGVVLNHTPAVPADDSEASRRAARLDDGTQIRWYMDPIFLGSYPADVIAHLGKDAPQVITGDLQTICQPLDFLGVNFYTRSVLGQRSGSGQPPAARGVTDMGWEIVPELFTQHLVRLHREYAPPPIFITENGMANADRLVNHRVMDTARIDYLRDHLQALAAAMQMGVDVRGYFYWSLLDNFEWDSGYTKRFGLVHVDYATQQRTAKDSAHWYRDFIRAHRLAHAARG